MGVHEQKRHPLVTQLLMVRLALGLHQHDVATAGGINRSTVASMESGKRQPSLENFSRYCAGLGYRLDLVPLDDDPAPPVEPRGIRLYTAKEVAEMLRVSRSTLFGLVRNGEIGSIKRGRFRFFTDEHIQEFVDRGEVSC